MFIPCEDLDELCAHVAGAHHLALLDEVLETPGIAEARGFPAIVHVEEGEVVAVGIVEFGLLLVGLLLLVLVIGTMMGTFTGYIEVVLGDLVPRG